MRGSEREDGESELERVLNLLKDGKVPGGNGIPNEV